MDLHQQLFLEALKASLENRTTDWEFDVSTEIWQEIFQLAEVHKVLPLIFEAVYTCPAVKNISSQTFAVLKRRSIGAMILQIQKTEKFLNLYKYLQEKELTALVVKGIICRQLYPKPDLRGSSDEDFLIEESSFLETVYALQEYGMRMQKESADIASEDEIGFLSSDHVSYIELHKRLFAVESEAYGNLNQFFEEPLKDCVWIEVQGTKVATLSPDRHLLYLICHALKHFMHSGFGIRQVCDIVLFANVYGTQLDWGKLLEQCRKIHADKFSAALFKIGKKYLNFDEEKAAYPDEWREIEVDESHMLQELLDSGIYGSTSMSRKHSSNMTLEAVASGKKGERFGNAVIKTMFPAAKDLEGRYHYLKKRPYLLPVAWSDRFLKYYKETRALEGDNAMDTIKIGNQRIELLKEYGIVKT